MAWSEVGVGRYSDLKKTLPQMLFYDPDWFFWAVENEVFSGALATEAELIKQRACNIKIPAKYGPNMEIQYFVTPKRTGFSHLKMVPANAPQMGSNPISRPVIDLSVPRTIRNYHKSGNWKMIRNTKQIIFGNISERMTKKRCEEFFEDGNNFTK